MPRRDSKNRPVSATEVVQIPLLPAWVDRITSEKLTVPDMRDKLLELLPQGYNLTESFDHDREQYTARLAGIDDRAANRGKLLYGNGRTPDLAIVSLYAKHFLGCTDGKWESTTGALSDMS